MDALGLILATMDAVALQVGQKGMNSTEVLDTIVAVIYCEVAVNIS